MNTWILVADGSRANLFSRHSDGQLEKLEGWDNPEGRLAGSESQTDDLGSARPGSSMTPPTDPKRHSQEVFARQLAAVLKERCTGFTRLLVVAAPKFLGDLRQQLDESVRKKVAAEFAKDLTQLSAHELAPHLDKLMETVTNA
jgi:protein required for attachment to host cells